MFIRELISNASDALEKLRHKLVSEGQTLPEMEIHLQTNAEKGTITIQVPPPVLRHPSLRLVRCCQPSHGGDQLGRACGQWPTSHTGMEEMHLSFC